MHAERKIDARIAMRRALDMRRDLGIDAAAPVCVFDLAERLEIEMKFVQETSIDGYYVKAPHLKRPLIAVSAFRPPGRRAFTCAHELGHHAFNHGNRIDEYIEDGVKVVRDADERAADIFAGYLLMPKPAVQKAFQARGWSISDCTAEQAYIASGQLGTSYAGLINHLCWSLRLINPNRAKQLLKITPKKMRSEILGRECPGDTRVTVVDAYWNTVAIDIEAGDIIRLPRGSIIEGDCIRYIDEHEKGTLIEGVTPGIGRACLNNCNWSAFVRVSRRQYIGRGQFRHLEETDND